MSRNTKIGLAVGIGAAVLLAASPLPHWNHYYDGKLSQVMEMENWIWVIIVIVFGAALTLGWAALERVLSFIASKRPEAPQTSGGAADPGEDGEEATAM